MANVNKEQVKQILIKLDDLLAQFNKLQKITQMNKSGKIKLSDQKFKQLENKYKKVLQEMEELNIKLKTLINN